MKVYLAAPWKNRPEAQAAAAYLESKGHIITKRWWEHADVRDINDPNQTDEDRQELVQQAVEDVEGVANCDVFILLNIQYSEGKTVETGLALAYGKPIIVVGKNTNLFHYLVNALVDDIVAAESLLQ